MKEIEVGNFVVLKDTGDTGEVVEILDDSTYRVRSKGSTSTYARHDILGLNPAQVHVLNETLLRVAEVIHAYHDEEHYDPVYDQSGKIIYSSAAAAVFQVLDFPRLIVELGNLSDRVTILQRDVTEMREK